MIQMNLLVSQLKHIVEKAEKEMAEGKASDVVYFEVEEHRVTVSVDGPDGYPDKKMIWDKPIN